MGLNEYLVPAGSKANICFNCQKACGKCSWTAVDPVTKKIRFEPIPGWTAEKVKLLTGHSHYNAVVIDTYHITGCPEYLADEPRPNDFKEVTNEQWEAMCRLWRIWGHFNE